MSKLNKYDLVRFSDSYLKNKERCHEFEDDQTLFVITSTDCISYGNENPITARVIYFERNKPKIGCMYAGMKESDFKKDKRQLNDKEIRQIVAQILN